MRLMYLFFLGSVLFASDRSRLNPYAGQAVEIQAGAKLYRRYCASCHAAGDRAPALASPVVQNMSSGDLFQLIKNGRMAQGMPSWAQLPEEQRWQIIAWLKALEPR
jgi:mono/diheme cytochrome c family protein